MPMYRFFGTFPHLFSHYILMQCLNPTLEGVRYAKNFNIWNFQVDANFSTILSHWKEIYIQFFSSKLPSSSQDGMRWLIKWRSCPNEAMSGRKSLRCGSKEGGMGHSQLPLHTGRPPPSPSHQPPAQKPSFVKLQKSTTQYIVHLLTIWFKYVREIWADAKKMKTLGQDFM